VVVTHPAGAAPGQPLPTVLLVHGGPWVRGTDLDWSAEPQFLASRGYRVLEVDFRGSTGLGGKHFSAGWRNWGTSMQDDLADALAWAAQQKLTDPARVCIYGASYGGYAALMSPIRHPDLYRCAISHVGVTDPVLLFSGNWTDISEQSRGYSLKTLIGDPEADAEMLRQASPLHRVKELKLPVMIVQGRQDRRVEPVHADRFVSAARAAGVSVERHDYEDGHGFYIPEYHADFLGKLEAFLARHIGAKPN
jgi:dipeptidyl aminopeptidase/acylaminoacyl peptidase